MKDNALKQEKIKVLEKELFVSTIDLMGINHQFGDGPPLLYETMVFEVKDGEVDFSDMYCDRYSTKEEALEGHKKVIKAIKEKRARIVEHDNYYSELIIEEEK